MANRRVSAIQVTLHLVEDPLPSDPQIAFWGEGEECGSGADGPDLWLERHQWEELGSPEEVLVTVAIPLPTSDAPRLL